MPFGCAIAGAGTVSGTKRDRDGSPIKMTARDVTTALECDPLLCRHPLLFKLQSEVLLDGTS